MKNEKYEKYENQETIDKLREFADQDERQKEILCLLASWARRICWVNDHFDFVIGKCISICFFNMDRWIIETNMTMNFYSNSQLFEGDKNIKHCLEKLNLII